ncbi:MAG: hypothetical protein A2Z25_18185 [Planctomycetes bacterium RBG_16_55_9]|nr:MAG: hypothetical protein A2Z25_18185 [Planctomycetes bacterium RBG_16_55_9]
MAETEECLVLKQLTDALDSLKISYAIGGSIVSSIYGKVRFTQDADIAVTPFAEKAGQLFDLLKKDFYISKDAMDQAITNRRSFNVIHLASAFKIDIFVQKDDDFHRLMFVRRKKVKLDESVDHLFDIVSAEDIVLLKLQWYESSGCVSERQWSDVLGVLAVQGQSLDMAYMRSCSEKLGLSDILQKAVEEACE